MDLRLGHTLKERDVRGLTQGPSLSESLPRHLHPRPRSNPRDLRDGGGRGESVSCPTAQVNSDVVSGVNYTEWELESASKEKTKNSISE